MCKTRFREKLPSTFAIAIACGSLRCWGFHSYCSSWLCLHQLFSAALEHSPGDSTCLCRLPDETDVDPEPGGDLLENWILREDALSAPQEESKDELPLLGDRNRLLFLVIADWCLPPTVFRIGALVLRQSALALQSASGLSHLRLNSHMMELSNKTNGVVEALGKDRIKSNLTQRNQKTTRRFSGMMYATELTNRCKLPVAKPSDRIRVAWDIMSICLIVMDVFLLPAAIAWELEEQTNVSFGKLIVQIFSAIAMVFWPLDTWFCRLNCRPKYYVEARALSEVHSYIPGLRVSDIFVSCFRVDPFILSPQIFEPPLARTSY